RGGAPLPGERPVDRATQEDRRQDDGGIHDDAGDGSQHELAGDLPEVRPHLPEKPEHAGALWEGRGRHVPNAGSSRSRVTRATITSRARLKSSLTAGTSSHRSIRVARDASSPRSQAKVTTAAAPATSAGVGRCGRRPSTSMPSARSPWMTRGGIASSGSVPADVALAPRPRAAARRLKYSAAMRLLAEPCKQTNRTFPRELMAGSYFTKTHGGWSNGNAISPIIAAAAMSRGLLTFQRKSTTRLTSVTSAVSQSPIAIRPSSTQAPRMVPIAAPYAPLMKPCTLRFVR